MKSEYDRIKKIFGENMAKLCRTLFPTLLNKEGLLIKLLLEHFDVSRTLYQDITSNGKIITFKDYIYGLTTEPKIKLIDVKRSVKELFEEKDYELFECKTNEELNSFKKYYYPGELLCSFDSDRLDKAYVFFAVKKNVDEIRREDFKSPEKEDEYGTSVLCIQFRKGDINNISIISRYNHGTNHQIKAPDCVFDNDLDNINPGLMVAFAREYGFNLISFKKDFSLPNYICDINGKYHKYNYQIKGFYYCSNNVIINSGRVVIEDYLDKNRYIICDCYVIDLVEKRIFLHDYNLKDSFIDEFIDIKRIDIRNNNETGTKTIEVFYGEGKYAYIIVDDANRIVEYHNHYLTNVESGFMWNSKALKVLDTPNLETAENGFLRYNEQVEELHLNKLKRLGNVALRHNKVLKIFEANSLEVIGNDCFYFNDSVEILYLPSARIVGKGFFYCNKSVKILNMLELDYAGPNYFKCNNNFKEVYLPSRVIDNIENKRILELMGVSLSSISNHHR